MLEFCRLFKESQIPIPAEEGGESTGFFYAMPSKPPALRQRDAQNANIVAALKEMIPEPLRSKLEVEMGKGRVFLQETMIAHNPPNQTKIEIRYEALKKHCPEATTEAFSEHLRKIEAHKEAERNAQ